MQAKLILTNYQDKQIAYLRDGCEIKSIWANSADSIVLGNIYVGKVKNIVKEIDAAFVEFLPGVKGFLPFSQVHENRIINRPNATQLKCEDEILVQVVKEPQKTKDASLTMDLAFTGKYLVLNPFSSGIHFSKKLKKNDIERISKCLPDDLGKECGVIIRTDATNVSIEDVIADYDKQLQNMRSVLQVANTRTPFTCLYEELPFVCKKIRDQAHLEDTEIITDNKDMYQTISAYVKEEQLNCSVRLYEDKNLSLSALYSLESTIEELLGKRVWLKSGGYLVIEYTEAMTVIDVNSGKNNKKRSDKTSYYHEINLEAAREIARQLRLRNLSGMILIDFINVDDKTLEEQLIKTVKTEIAKDTVKTVFADITALGICELTRKKIEKPLHEILQITC